MLKVDPLLPNSPPPMYAERVEFSIVISVGHENLITGLALTGNESVNKTLILVSMLTTELPVGLSVIPEIVAPFVTDHDPLPESIVPESDPKV